MAITVEARTNIIGLVVGMFKAAPGASVLSGLVAAYESGSTIKQLAANLAATTEFKGIFPTFLTNGEFSKKVVAQLLTEASDAAKTEAEGVLTAALNGGMSRSDAFVAAITYIDGVASTDTTFGTSAAAFDNKVAVAVYYSVDKQLSGSSLSDLQDVVVSVTSAASTVTAAKATADGTSTVGKTFTLTTGTDTITGTSGDDTINVGALATDGTTAANTLNALDTIDGGSGNDTLVVDTTGNKNNIAGTVTNVENLTIVGSGAAINGDATISISGYSGKFTLRQTADTAVAVSGTSGQTLALDRVADTTTLTAAYSASAATATLSNSSSVGDATFSISGTGLTAANVSTNATATGKTLTVTDTGNKVKTATIDASAGAAVNVTSTALESVVVKGAGKVTLTAGTAPSKSIDSSASTGGITYATDLVAQQFTGGAGKDTVQFGATTKAQTLGAGDDTATISADLGTGGSIDGGDGTDTLVMTATLAATLDDSTAFNAKVSNFEKLSVTAATNQTLNLLNLDGINYVKAAGVGNTLTIDNMISGGTFEFADASTATAINVKDASSGTADVVNVVVSAAATVAAGTLTVANVETININADDTATSPASDGTVKHTLTLTADKATTVKVTGDASLNLTLTGSTKVTTIDASAATSGLTTNLSVASGITLTGSAKADAITLGQLSIVTGGSGADAYTITTPTNGNTYSTITDFVVGETIQFTDKGTNTVAALGAKVALADTAAFADFLAAASAGNGGTNGVEKWFVFGGNTYVVHDVSAEATFQNGADEIVKLTGVLDLSASTMDTNGLLTYVAA